MSGRWPDFGEDGHSDEAIQVRTSIDPGAQRGPNTDPGLPGETGVSGDCGTVYGIDGLKVGPGVDGAPSMSGDAPEKPRFAPGTWAPAPRAWAGPTAASAPNKATPAAKDNAASAIRLIFLLPIGHLR
jgi:hypothetical protein